MKPLLKYIQQLLCHFVYSMRHKEKELIDRLQWQN